MVSVDAVASHSCMSLVCREPGCSSCRIGYIVAGNWEKKKEEEIVAKKSE